MNIPFLNKPKDTTKPKPKLQSSKQQAAKVVLKAPKWHLELPKSVYVDIVVEDVKKVLGRDNKTLEDKETYNDFMEEHFGK